MHYLDVTDGSKVGVKGEKRFNEVHLSSLETSESDKKRRNYRYVIKFILRSFKG